MAINPNIALGVQPIQQQPNMLAQYAQVMAIKAAQQEMEGNEGFKSALVGGMDPTDPRILQYGKPGRETFKAAGEGRIKQLEAASKSNEILGGIFGGVMQDPSTGPQAVSRLVEMGVMTRDQAQKVITEAGNNPDAWRSLAKPYYEGAISAAQRLTAETSRYSTNVAAGTAANRLKFDTENRDYDRANPTLRQPVAVIKDGEVTLVTPDQAVGMTPATPGAEKALEKKVIAKEGKESVNRVLSNLYSEYGNLVKSGGITDTRKSVEDNISARTGASAAGQLAGSFTGSESQSFRDTIEQTRPLLLTAIMKATGLSATQLNSNVELQTYLKTATDPKVSIQSNVKALNNISTMFGLGEKFDVPDIKSPKEAKASDAPPAGLSPDIAGLWKYMTPEDRKLWQK